MFDKALSTIAPWVAAIIIIVFIVYMVKDVIKLISAQESLLKIIGRVLSVFLIIGIVFAAINYKKFGELFSEVATSAVESVATDAADLFE